MKILQINSYYKLGSTGNIVFDITQNARKENIMAYVAAGNIKAHSDDAFLIKSKIGWLVSVLKSRVFGRPGFYDFRSTKKLIEWIEQIKPDVIHLHNLHGFYINVELLFCYLKQSAIPVVWTFHDCWPLTGHCAHYDFISCDKWKTGCHHCEQLKLYPICYIDKSEINYANKKNIFTSLPKEQLVLITPSIWLASQIKESYMEKYEIKVINNGINLSTFYPRKTEIKKKLGIKDEKKVLLAVTFGYNIRKGLSHINKLGDLLDNSFQIIIVGIEDRNKSKFNKNILILEKTANQNELAELYSCADVFINFTLEDSFPTVNLEALACGTPVVTYESGGSPECIDVMSGIVVPKNDIDSFYKGILTITQKGKEFYCDSCVERAKSLYDKLLMTDKYISLYNNIYENYKSE